MVIITQHVLTATTITSTKIYKEEFSFQYNYFNLLLPLFSHLQTNDILKFKFFLTSIFQNADIEGEAVETSKKIDIQVASLKTLLESLKLETIRYLAGIY